MAALRVKYFQDPLYGQIGVESPLLLGLIDSPAVQRLRRVRQLGVSYLTFLGAEHSRFSHSLGAMTLMGRALDHLSRDEGLRLSPKNRELAMAAALLHDIGHGAFSHTLEAELIRQHERMGVRLLREDPQLKKLLGVRAEPLALLLEGGAHGPEAALIQDLLSSQLDVDRLDYLVRDAHYTGVNSGQVDLQRIIASLTLWRGRLAVKERGLLAVEEYFLARYFMYWKVYFHKTSRAMELSLKAVLRRATMLWRTGLLARDSATPPLAALLDSSAGVSTADFLGHDDSDVLVAVKRWALGNDAVLAELAGGFLARRQLKLLWESTSGQALPARTLERVRAWFEARQKGSAESLLIEDRLEASPYDRRHPVLVVGARGVRELSALSPVVRGIAISKAHVRYYVPARHLNAARALLRRP